MISFFLGQKHLCSSLSDSSSLFVFLEILVFQYVCGEITVCLIGH